MVQLVKNFFADRKIKNEILKKISRKFESEEIFNLFLEVKLKNNLKTMDNPVKKVFKLKKGIMLLEINDIKKNNTSKKVVIDKSFKFLQKKFSLLEECYREFNNSETYHFSIDGKRKSICFLISEKNNHLLKDFAFHIFLNDIFVHAKKKFGERKNLGSCTISSKDKKLLKELGYEKKLGKEWGFVDFEIKSKRHTITKITLEELKEILISSHVSVTA